MGNKFWLFLWVAQLLVLAPLNAIIVASGNVTQAIFLGMNLVFGTMAWFFWRESKDDKRYGSWSKS